MTLICCAMRPSITMARVGGFVAQEGHAMEIGFNGKMTVRMRSKYEWSYCAKHRALIDSYTSLFSTKLGLLIQVSGAESADTIC